MKKTFLTIGCCVFAMLFSVLAILETYYSSLNLSEVDFQRISICFDTKIQPTDSSRSIAQIDEYLYSFDRNENGTNMILKSMQGIVANSLVLSQNENNVYGSTIDYAYVNNNDIYYLLVEANGFTSANSIWKTDLDLTHKELIIDSSIYGKIENKNIFANDNSIFYVVMNSDNYCIVKWSQNKETVVCNFKESINVLCVDKFNVYFISEKKEIYCCNTDSGNISKIQFHMPLRILNKRILFLDANFIDDSRNYLQIHLKIFNDLYDMEGEDAILVLNINTGQRKLIDTKNTNS